MRALIMRPLLARIVLSSVRYCGCPDSRLGPERCSAARWRGRHGQRAGYNVLERGTGDGASGPGMCVETRVLVLVLLDSSALRLGRISGYLSEVTGSYTITGVPPGTYTPVVRYGNTTIGQGSPIVVTADTTTTADIDLTSTAGEVVGTARVNGQVFRRTPLSTSLLSDLYHPGDS